MVCAIRHSGMLVMMRMSIVMMRMRMSFNDLTLSLTPRESPEGNFFLLRFLAARTSLAARTFSLAAEHGDLAQRREFGIDLRELHMEAFLRLRFLHGLEATGDIA